MIVGSRNYYYRSSSYRHWNIGMEAAQERILARGSY